MLLRIQLRVHLGHAVHDNPDEKVQHDHGAQQDEGDEIGGGNSTGLKTVTLPITLRFIREIRNARDERAGCALGSGSEFALDWKQNEAVVLSFDG